MVVRIWIEGGSGRAQRGPMPPLTRRRCLSASRDPTSRVPCAGSTCSRTAAGAARLRLAGGSVTSCGGTAVCASAPALAARRLRRDSSGSVSSHSGSGRGAPSGKRVGSMRSVPHCLQKSSSLYSRQTPQVGHLKISRCVSGLGVPGPAVLGDLLCRRWRLSGVREAAACGCACIPLEK